jgi:uncharacterized protein
VTLLGWVGAIVLGFASGVLSGMFGVGGAVITTPGIRALGATPIEAVGSTIPAILPGALSGAWRYRREGLIDGRVAVTCGLVGSVMAVAGSALSDEVSAHYLMLLTAALLLWTGIKNMRAVRVPVTAPLRAADDVEVVDDGVPDRTSPVPIAILVAVGAAAGMLAGLLGVGGGIIMVPAFTTLLQMPPKRAVASSLVAVAMFSVPAMITHALLGHIDWSFALALVVGVVPGAQIGARITIVGSEERLRLLMGVLYTVLAVGYGYAELRAI